MPKKGDEYTLEDLDRDILEALNTQPGESQGGERKPNALEMLKAQAKLTAGKTKK